MQGEVRQNGLLAALAHGEAQRWQARLERIVLAPGQLLPCIPGGDVYFPTSCVVSIHKVLRNGSSAQLAVVGREGVLGPWLQVEGHCVPGQCVVQHAGRALRLPARVLAQESEFDPVLTRLLLRWTLAVMGQFAQTAVCYRVHSVEQQLCRWILQSLDRIDGDTIAVTHESIAGMLGVRRESVTEAAHRLQATGLLQLARGRVRVLDRAGVEQRSCECYAVLRAEAAALLPLPAG